MKNALAQGSSGNRLLVCRQDISIHHHQGQMQQALPQNTVWRVRRPCDRTYCDFIEEIPTLVRPPNKLSMTQAVSSNIELLCARAVAARATSRWNIAITTREEYCAYLPASVAKRARSGVLRRSQGDLGSPSPHQKAKLKVKSLVPLAWSLSSTYFMLPNPFQTFLSLSAFL